MNGGCDCRVDRGGGAWSRESADDTWSFVRIWIVMIMIMMVVVAMMEMMMVQQSCPPIHGTHLPLSLSGPNASTANVRCTSPD